MEIHLISQHMNAANDNRSVNRTIMYVMCCQLFGLASPMVGRWFSARQHTHNIAPFQFLQFEAHCAHEGMYVWLNQFSHSSSIAMVTDLEVFLSVSLTLHSYSYCTHSTLSQMPWSKCARTMMCTQPLLNNLQQAKLCVILYECRYRCRFIGFLNRKYPLEFCDTRVDASPLLLPRPLLPLLLLLLLLAHL